MHARKFYPLSHNATLCCPTSRTYSFFRTNHIREISSRSLTSSHIAKENPEKTLVTVTVFKQMLSMAMVYCCFQRYKSGTFNLFSQGLSFEGKCISTNYTSYKKKTVYQKSYNEQNYLFSNVMEHGTQRVNYSLTPLGKVCYRQCLEIVMECHQGRHKYCQKKKTIALIIHKAREVSEDLCPLCKTGRSIYLNDTNRSHTPIPRSILTQKCPCIKCGLSSLRKPRFKDN